MIPTTCPHCRSRVSLDPLKLGRYICYLCGVVWNTSPAGAAPDPDESVVLSLKHGEALAA